MCVRNTEIWAWGVNNSYPLVFSFRGGNDIVTTSLVQFHSPCSTCYVNAHLFFFFFLINIFKLHEISIVFNLTTLNDICDILIYQIIILCQKSLSISIVPYVGWKKWSPA
jgi:hypothetical protein